ncbi:DsbA family protein [Candidatus Nomurabacteria bacterium]|nr:DsbA family protein [Candidatus Nomurabacteria bacterium]
MEYNKQNNLVITKKERKELYRQEKATEEQAKQRSKMIRKWIKRIVTLFLIAGSIVGIFWYRSNKPVTPTNEILSVVSDDWVKGNKDAPITIVEYLDFECEACGAYYPVIKRLSEEYKDEVRFVVRYFPLPGHKNSMTSALAVETAGKQGKYWEMHNVLFENQRDWGEKQTPDPKIFENYARQIGLDMNQYEKDIISQEVKSRIERDRKSGQKLNLQGTPSFFLNGEKIENPQGYEDFKSLLQSTISEKNKSR